MITRTQSISHQSRYARILFGGACAAAIFGAASPWTLLDAPLAHAAPINCPMSPSATPVCPAYIPSQPAPSACPVVVPSCPGYIPPPQALNNPANPPIWNGSTAPDGKPDGKSDKPGSPPDGKPGSPGTGSGLSQSAPPAGAPNPTDRSGPAPDHSAPAPDSSGPAPAAPPAPAPDASGPAPAAPPAPAPSAPMPDMSAPAPSAPMPDMSAPAPMPDMGSSAPAPMPDMSSSASSMPSM
jgi:hypothetical protein